MENDQVRRFFRNGPEFAEYFRGGWRGRGVHAHPGLSQSGSVLIDITVHREHHLFSLTLPGEGEAKSESATYRIDPTRWELFADAADYRDASADLHLQALSEGEAYLILKGADRQNHILFAGRIMRRRAFLSHLAGFIRLALPTIKKG